MRHHPRWRGLLQLAGHCPDKISDIYIYIYYYYIQQTQTCMCEHPRWRCPFRAAGHCPDKITIYIFSPSFAVFAQVTGLRKLSSLTAMHVQVLVGSVAFRWRPIGLTNI